MNTPHDHDHNDMTPLDYALAHNDQLIKRLAGAESDLEFRRDLYALQTEQLDKVRSELVDARNENNLWKAEAKRWRDMYLEYDEILEERVNEAVQRLEDVWEGLDELKKKVEDEY
jgi:hypothetical protein